VQARMSQLVQINVQVFEKVTNGDPLIHPRQNVSEKNNNKFMVEGFVVFFNHMASLKGAPIFMSS